MSVPAILDWARLSPAQQGALLARPAAAADATVGASVAAILARVRDDGDAALAALSARFDPTPPAALRVGEQEWADAQARVPPGLRAAIAEAAGRIEAFHRAGMANEFAVDTAPGVRCERVLRPIARVGLYVPAGTAPLPSTALMLAVPARLAGCTDVVLCTPARADGFADPVVLHAAAACGVRTAFKVGGAQAIAAMAFGTATVPRCDKVFGPGNAYVTEAKRQLAALGAIGIDLPAGPSEVLVIADAGARPAFVAADLLSQAEHAVDAQVVLLSDDDALLAAVRFELQAQLRTLPRTALAAASLANSRLVRVDSIAQAVAIANDYAPEHLILAVRQPRAWLVHVRAAGSVFLGDWSPEALGDYCSGTNHVLPTAGAARFCSGLSVASFQLAITVQEVQPAGLAAIGPCAMALAASEGLDAHARAVDCRLREVSA